MPNASYAEQDFPPSDSKKDCTKLYSNSKLTLGTLNAGLVTFTLRDVNKLGDLIQVYTLNNQLSNIPVARFFKSRSVDIAK